MAGQPDESAPTAEHPAETPTVVQPGAPRPEDDGPSAAPAVEPARGTKKRGRTTLPLAAVIVAAFLGLYFHGNLDRVFYPVGLNFNECARNGLGATFCGKELDEYRARLERVKAEGEAAQAKIKEESARRQQEGEAEERKANETRARERREYLTTAKRQQEALAAREAKIQSEGEEAQTKIKEEGEEAQAKIKEQGEEAQAQIKE
jgi:hypothetical protein